MIYDLINTFLKKTDPEIAHSIAMKSFKSNLLPLNLLVSKPKLILLRNYLIKNLNLL